MKLRYKRKQFWWTWHISKTSISPLYEWWVWGVGRIKHQIKEKQ